MKAHYYCYHVYSRHLTSITISTFYTRSVIKLFLDNRPVHSKKMSELSDVLNPYLSNCRKFVEDINKTIQNLKMKMLRSSVPQELFKDDLNAIIDKSMMFSIDTEKYFQRFTTIGSCNNPTQIQTSTYDSHQYSTDDIIVLGDDPFDYSEITPKMASPAQIIEYNKSSNADPLAMAIAKSQRTSEKASKKRKSICLSEPVSKLMEKTHKKGNYIEDADGWVTAFIDGSCLNNGKGSARAGLGVWFSANSTLNVSEPVQGRLTNNVGEIEAATRAIEQAYSVGVTKLRLKTDSMFLMNCMQKWRFSWVKNGWKTAAGKPVINRIDIEKLTKAIDNTKMTVCWEHVKAHSGIVGNDAADFLAKQGAEKCKLREFLKPA